MVYWVSFSKTGIGEVIRERAYDSIVKTRRYAMNVLKREKEFQWADIHTSKDNRLHVESIQYGLSAKGFVMERYSGEYVLNADGTLGKKLIGYRYR